MGEETDHTPWYRSARFWTGPFLWGLGVFLAGLLAYGWVLFGGFPRDHDKYGVVPVPGQALIELPGEDVRLDFENDTTGSGDTESIADQPGGLAVRVTPAAGGEPLEIEKMPSWLFSSITNDRGHEPYAKIDVPAAGGYLVETGDDATPLAAQTNPAGAASSDPNAGPAIAIGLKPWTPLGSVYLGAALCFVAVMMAMLLFSLPFRLIR